MHALIFQLGVHVLKIQNLNLQTTYFSDEDFRHLSARQQLYYFVPPNFVHIAWDVTQQDLEEYNGLEDFSEYFSSMWIKGNYSIQLWKYFLYDGPRTNNRLEGWYSGLKGVIKKPHSNIYKLLHTFKT